MIVAATKRQINYDVFELMKEVKLVKASLINISFFV
jgi:hypothetical protein